MKSLSTRENRHPVAALLATVILAVAVMMPSGSVLADGIVVVVNPANPVASLDKAEVARLFLGRSKTFPDGGDATVVTSDEGNSTRAAFEQAALGKSESQMKAYWAKQMFSGQGSPPDSVGDDAAVKAKVASDPSAVGYLPASMVDGTVKVVMTL